MCIIIADKDKSNSKDLNLLQVIEAIAYSKNNKSADVYLDLLIENKRQKESDIFLIHRGYASAKPAMDNLLCTKAVKRYENSHPQITEFSPSEVLYGIYKDRIQSNSDGPKVFFERKNCYLREEKPVIISNWVPEIAKIEPAVRTEKDTAPPFTAFSIPNIPIGTTWLRFILELNGPTYDYLVDNLPMFGIDGPDRVKKQITDELLLCKYLMPEETHDFFQSNIIDHEIPIKAYDIVVFQPGTIGVESPLGCEPVTADIYDAPINDDQLSSCASLFVSRTMDFWLSVWYKKDERIINSTSLSQHYRDALIH